MFRKFIWLLALCLMCGTVRAQNFGMDGSDTALTTPTLPSYAQVNISGASTWTWGTGVTCWYSAGSFTVTITASGTGHQVTFYMVDGDSTTRTETVNGTAIANFSKGLYQSFPLNIGTNVFTFTHTAGGANAVLTSIFFDTPVIVTPAATHSVTLSWTASTSTGVTGYNLYRNGTLLTSLGVVTSYVDTTVAAGVTYSYTVTTLQSTTESAQQGVSQITFSIPMP